MKLYIPMWEWDCEGARPAEKEPKAYLTREKAVSVAQEIKQRFYVEPYPLIEATALEVEFDGR